MPERKTRAEQEPGYRPPPVAADADIPTFVLPQTALSIRAVCRIVSQIAGEMLALAGGRVQLRRDRRRALCHIRQISMYVCHVALCIPMGEIGKAFGRDRTTVGHACGVVEDRRDDPVYDDFVASIERIATSVFVVPLEARQ